MERHARACKRSRPAPAAAQERKIEKAVKIREEKSTPALERASSSFNASGKRVVFIVRGKRFETYDSTLAAMPNTLLGSIFAKGSDAKKAALIKRNSNEEYELDRDPAVFAAVLDSYRTGVLGCPPDVAAHAFKAEVTSFYRLPSEIATTRMPIGRVYVAALLIQANRYDPCSLLTVARRYIVVDEEAILAAQFLEHWTDQSAASFTEAHAETRDPAWFDQLYVDGDDPLPCESLGGPYSIRLLRYEVPGERAEPTESLVYAIPKAKFKENSHSLIESYPDEPYVPDLNETVAPAPPVKKKAPKQSMPVGNRLRRIPAVKMNVGGELFEVSPELFTAYTDTMLGAMFSSSIAKPDEKGQYFLDRNPDIFRHVLRFYEEEFYMRRPSDIQYDVLNAEMEFYLLPHEHLFLPSLTSFYLVAVCIQGNRDVTNTMLFNTVAVGELAEAKETAKQFFCKQMRKYVKGKAVQSITPANVETYKERFYTKLYERTQADEARILGNPGGPYTARLYRFDLADDKKSYKTELVYGLPLTIVKDIARFENDDDEKGGEDEDEGDDENEEEEEEENDEDGEEDEKPEEKGDEVDNDEEEAESEVEELE